MLIYPFPFFSPSLPPSFSLSLSLSSFPTPISSFASRIKWMNIGKKIGKGTFDIPTSILELIYMQSVLWLGFFFSPLLPAIILLTSFLLFYVKKYSLIWNLEPEKKGFQRSARTNYFFLALMLLALFIAIIPVSYAITQCVHK